MNRLVIIGNGFDLAHGLKTTYKNFIEWYLSQSINELKKREEKIYHDFLFSIELLDTCGENSWILFLSQHYELKSKTPTDLFAYFLQYPQFFQVNKSQLFELIYRSYENKGWVDIEKDYYSLLKKSLIKNITTFGKDIDVSKLNEQLMFLQNNLLKYLKEQDAPIINKKIAIHIHEGIRLNDISTIDRKLSHNELGIELDADDEKIKYKYEELEKLKPKSIMLLDFNYTSTTDLYNISTDTICNHIHGELSHPDKVIFGYGDELDKDYKKLEEMNDNELLRNIKSVKYLESNNYRNMLNFIESAPFQVYIMGHSCGNSDRTLLNTIFEHKNCVSIKPFYYQKKDGSDNYLELVQNISRNFTDPKLFRDKVVNKTQCAKL